MNHIDLFSGLGGFSLAAQWNGIQTEVFCEKDERCRDFLGRTYPGIPIIPDIREFDGTLWRGRFLLTAGVPCQPASRAGKQGGKGDDRWLWGDAVRILKEARTTWAIFENPPGIEDLFEYGISLEVDSEGNAVGEVGTVVDRVGRSVFVQTLEEIEQSGYAVEIHQVPACAVNSPQLRARYWIVAHREESNDGRSDTRESERQIQQPGIGNGSIDMAHRDDSGREGRGELGEPHAGRKTETDRRHDITRSTQGDMAYTEDNGHQRPRPAWSRRAGFKNGGQRRFWSNSIWLPCADGKLRRAPDDSVGVVDGLHRSVLAALGNSIVPEVAAEIIKAIKGAG